MPPRTVAVKLTAEATGYLATISKATLATQQFASKSATAIAKHDQSINKLSNTAGLLGAGMLAGVGFVVKSAAQFDKAMSAVSATGNDARINMDGLRKAAIDMGASTAFSATEAAKGIENMLKAGVSARDVMGGGLKGALDLAAAGNLEVGDAAEIAATAMAQFNLTGREVPHIADLLAAGAGKAQGEVADMGAALKQSGLVASQFGLSLEDTTGTLSAFANAGLIGSDSGTSFKTMLLSLASPSEKAKGLMEDLGIAAYDSGGQFVGVTDLAGQLQEKLGGLTQAERDAALATIFGTDAIRAANVLYKEGATGIQGWIDQTNDAGFAAKVARERLNNLSGDVEQLQGAFESAFIKGGSGANEALRGLTQEATGAVRAFGNLPAPVLESGVKIAAVTGIGLLAVAGIGKLATGVVSAKSAFNELSAASPKLSKGLRGVGKAAGIATVAVVGLQVLGAIGRQISGEFTPNVDEAANALLRLSSGNRTDLDKLFTFSTGRLIKDDIDGVDEALRRVAAHHWYDKIGEGFDQLTGDTDAATSKIKANFAAMDTAISSLGPEEAGQAFKELRVQAEAAGIPLEELTRLFPKYSDQVRDTANATGHTVTSTEELADIMSGDLPAGAQASYTELAKVVRKTGGVGDAAKDAKKQLDDLTESMFANANAAIELQGSEDSLEAAYDAATKSVKENGRTHDKNTEAGRNNRESLRNLATASINYRQKLIEQGKKQETVTATTEKARKKFIETAIKMHYTKEEAIKLANGFGLVDTKIDSIDGQKVVIKFKADTSWKDSSGVKWSVNLSAPSSVGRKASGGPVSGPGTGTSDSIPMLLSNGEFVVRASETAKHRPLLEDINAGKMATGGYVDLDMQRAGLRPANSAPGNIMRLRDQYARGFGEQIGKEMAKYLAPKFPGGGGGFTAASGGSNRAIGRAMMLQRWGASQWPPLNSLWTRESGWNTHALNRSSGAYGIPQSLPASKMASAGSDWRNNPATQIKWGLGYISQVYGSPAGAWAHSQRTGWYDRGGLLKPGLTLAYNGTGRDEVVTPARNIADYSYAHAGGSMGGGGTIVVNQHFHFDRYFGNRDELIRELNTAKRQGRLDVILR